MTEYVLPEIMDKLSGTGLLWFHPRDSRSVVGRPGWPDLTIASHRGLIVREIKPDPASTLSPAQQRWRWALLAAGISYAVWTKDDLANGTIDHELEVLR